MLEFGLQFFLFWIATTLVIGSSCMITLWLWKFRMESWLKFLLTASTLTYALIIGGGTLLGMLHLFYYPAVLLMHAGVFGGLLWYLYPKLKEHWHEIVPEDVFPKIDWMLYGTLFAPLLLIVFTRFFNATFQVPIEYDNLAYHLPFVVEWLQNGHLWEVYYSAYAGPLGYYPANYGLVDAWLMMPFGNDLLVNLVNLPVVILFPFVMYGVARRMHVSHKPALLIIALFMMLPVTLRQVGTPLVDLFFSMSFLLGVYFLLSYIQENKWYDMLLSGLALGLFMGTKYLGLVYTIPLAILGAAILVFRLMKKRRVMWQGIGVFWGGIMATGGFWYLRNLFNSGNPVFPTEVSVLGLPIFGGYQGITDNLVETSLAQNIPVNRSYGYFFDGIFQMVGAPLFLIIVGMTILLFLILIYLGKSYLAEKKKERIQNLDHLILYGSLAILLLVYFVGYWVSPYSFKDLIPNVRYAFMFLLFGLMAIGIVISRLKLLQPVFYVAGSIAILYNFVFLILFPPLAIQANEKLVLDFYQLEQYAPYAFFFGVFLYGILLLFYLAKHINLHKGMVYVIGSLYLSTALLGTLYFGETREDRELLRTPLYSQWYAKTVEWLYLLNAAEWINANANEAKLAYTGFNMHYPFFGRNLEREVDYININDCQGCRYVDYRESKESILRDPDYSHWKENLAAGEKEYIVIADRFHQSQEHQWIRTYPEAFQRVFRDGYVYVYKIK